MILHTSGVQAGSSAARDSTKVRAFGSRVNGNPYKCKISAIPNNKNTIPTNNDIMAILSPWPLFPQGPRGIARIAWSGSAGPVPDLFQTGAPPGDPIVLSKRLDVPE